MVREELITSRGELRDLQVELRAVNGDLNDKETQLEAARREASEGKVLLKTARRESSEAVNLAEWLNEECHGLRADLHLRVSLVAQRDEVIRQLRDQASAQWAFGWLAFQQKTVHAYSDLDFNFDLPSDEEVEESFSMNYSQDSGTPVWPIPHLRHPFLLLTSELLCSCLPDVDFHFFFSHIYFLFCFVLFCFVFFFFLMGLRPKTYVASTSINIHHIYIR